MVSSKDSSSLTIRACQYRDLDRMADVSGQMRSGLDTTQYGTRLEFSEQLQYVRQWYGPLKCLQLFPNPLQHFFSTYVAETQGQLAGFIQVSPFNDTHSTWRVERIAAFPPSKKAPKSLSSNSSSTPSTADSRVPQQSPRAVLSPSDTTPSQPGQYGGNGSMGTNGNGSGETNGNGSKDTTSVKVSSKALPRARSHQTTDAPPLGTDIASQLLRYCLDTLWEPRTWLVEVGVSDNQDLALYRHHGFQPLAHVTYWAIAPDLLASLAERPAAALNLRPVSNADAGLLHQLDTVSMPPLVRQVFDRHVSDFKTHLSEIPLVGIQRLMNPKETLRYYVFEPQRKAAIGYFQLDLCQDGSQPHTAELTVHPAYTWLYAELLTQMAQIVQKYPEQSIQLTSSDYQTEREEYLVQVGATRIQHTLLMSRSVWHKVRETKQVTLENIQFSGVLQGWQQGQKPIPGRFSFDSPQSPSPSSSEEKHK